MNDLFIISSIMFFGIPLIALFDYLIFKPMLERNMISAIKEYNETGKINISPNTWIPACVMESLFFISGLVLGYGLIK